jgi:hypothetical protein
LSCPHHQSCPSPWAAMQWTRSRASLGRVYSSLRSQPIQVPPRQMTACCPLRAFAMGPIAGAASGRCAMRFRRIVRVSEWKYALSGRNRRPLRDGFETPWQTTLRPGPRRLLWSRRRTISMSCLVNPRRNAEALQSIRDVRALSAKGKAGPTVSERDHALEKCRGGLRLKMPFRSRK